jgi:hypothetical protein
MSQIISITENADPHVCYVIETRNLVFVKCHLRRQDRLLTGHFHKMKIDCFCNKIVVRDCISYYIVRHVSPPNNVLTRHVYEKELVLHSQCVTSRGEFEGSFTRCFSVSSKS